MYQGNLIICILFHAIYAVPISAVTCWAICKLFAERLFGHILDRQLVAVKAAYDVKLEGVKAEYNAKLEGVKTVNDVNLEGVKHGQNTKIENLRAEINHINDRGKHSNEREYAALSAIWEQYVELHYAALVAVVDYIRVDALNEFTDDDLETFMVSKDLTEQHKQLIRRAKDRQRAYIRVKTWARINEAQTAYYNFNVILRKQGIFIPAELKKEFEEGAETCLFGITAR